MSDKKKHECCGHDHDENCCHEHDVEETITITIDDDTEAECQILGVFDVGEKSYIALLPLEEDAVLLFGYEEGEDDFQLIPIEDDAEFEEVSTVFDELMEDAEEYSFDEYDDDDSNDEEEKVDDSDDEY